MDIKVDKNTVVVFDLDDTLYNELDFLKSAYSTIAKKLDPNNWKRLYVLMLSQYRCKEDVFGIISSKYKIGKNELIQIYREHLPNITLFDGVMETIGGIIAKKGKIGIITDGRTKTQLNKIDSLGLSGLVDFTIISEDIGTEKPNEKNFRIIEEKSKGHIYYYIADNLKKDFIAPNSLGWRTICIMDNGLNIHCNSYLYLDKVNLPNEYISSFTELKII